MVSKRIIPCLDVKEGRTVKGVNFEGLTDIGDPVELGAYYASQGADELVYLDITASREGRSTFLDLVRRVADRVDIPFTVGGGISSLAEAEALHMAGADKISVRSHWKKLTQLALSSFIPSAAPKTSRYPSSFTAIATNMATFSYSPPQLRRR